MAPVTDYYYDYYYYYLPISKSKMDVVFVLFVAVRLVLTLPPDSYSKRLRAVLFVAAALYHVYNNAHAPAAAAAQIWPLPPDGYNNRLRAVLFAAVALYYVYHNAAAAADVLPLFLNLLAAAVE